MGRERCMDGQAHRNYERKHAEVLILARLAPAFGASADGWRYRREGLLAISQVVRGLYF